MKKTSKPVAKKPTKKLSGKKELAKAQTLTRVPTTRTI
jgi:hypothetical protein